MDYVGGKPITKYADEHELSVPERLKLFRVVCSAVSYAHQNLVIHRDIKPSNVIATKDGEIKLLDFGIAKLLQEAGAEQADVTLTVHRVMTPEYASPEQVKGEPVTTVSDVYSLGVFLYELLTGQRPYKLKQRTPDEITKAICDQEPERPSTAVSRGQESEVKSQKLLRGDLDNIVLKALRKEPQRRYASVDSLSEDIRRHLEGLPVRARKDTPAYRASKFVQRHKLSVAATVLVALALVAGTITTAWQAHEANVERARAEKRFHQLRKLAHSVLFDYHDAIAALPGSTVTRQRLVKDGLEYLDNLSSQAGNDTGLLRELADAYERVAAVQGGVAQSNHGTALTTSNLGDTQGAIRNLGKALVIREKVSVLEPGNQDVRKELAYCYEKLGVLYVYNGPAGKAVEDLRKATPVLEALLASDPANEDFQYNLVDNYQGLAKALGSPISPNLGDTGGAIEYMNKAQPIIEKLAADHPANLAYQLYLAGLHNAFGWVLGSAAGKLPEALEHARKALALYQGLVDAEPANTLYRNQLVNQLGATGRIMLNMGNAEDALKTFQRGLGICESILAADPNDAYTRKSVALAHRNVAEAFAAAGNRAAALKEFHKAQKIFAELVAKDPANIDSRTKWSYVYLAMSKTQSESDDLHGAVSSALEGIRIDEALLAASPANALIRKTLAQLYETLGSYNAKLAEKSVSSSAERNKNWRAARDAYQKSLRIWQDAKNKGTLSGADAAKPDELVREVANCDAVLNGPK
jgi:eukaryotic-like serine/threonine-protein kinase